MTPEEEQIYFDKGIVFIHFGLVTLMLFLGWPRVHLYTSLLWGGCCLIAIPFTEEGFCLEIPPLWRYRHLFALGISFVISQSV